MDGGGAAERGGRDGGVGGCGFCFPPANGDVTLLLRGTALAPVSAIWERKARNGTRRFVQWKTILVIIK